MRTFVRVLFVAILLALGAVAFLGWQHQRVAGFAATPFGPSSDLVVQIPQGSGPQAISQRLAAAGVISDEKLFIWNLRYLRRNAGQLKSGDYLFKADVRSTPNEIVDRLLKGEVLNVKVTVPEGLRIEEQALIVAEAGIGDAAEFTRLARDASFARSLGVEGASLEGYLFPDTYLVPKNTTTTAMLKLMVERFEKAWKEAETHRLPSVSLTRAEAVVLASIIEKETGKPEERPRISCVFHNRLRQDIKLQTDPTVLYAKFLATGRWDESRNIRRSDLDRVHPYNTYAVKGLPPGPIANAGEAALTAALRPITCNDLFFVSKNDGTHVFCPTLACHEANVEKWQREFFRRKKAGEQH